VSAVVGGVVRDLTRGRNVMRRKREDVHADNPSRLKMKVNGVTLSGVTVGGFWVWACEEYPDLVEQHSGKDDPTPMVTAFTERARVEVME
jgi:hypothetical protein